MIANALVWLPVALVVAVAMDFWAALLHGRVWHAWLWPIHRSHHDPRPPGERFETNDALSALHAPIAIALILVGCRAAPGVWREAAFGVGVGMTLFGVGYLVVHDGLVHGRLPVGFLLRLRYFRALVRAHRVHHAGVVGGAPYGLFFGAWELARTKRVKRARQPASTARALSSSDPRRQHRARG